MKKLLPIAITLIIGNSAQAAFIDYGTTSFDNVNGLEWLDLTATGGLSYEQVANGAGGFIADGWRIAKGTEVRKLVADNIDPTFPYYSLEPATFTRAHQLITQMGITQSFNSEQGGYHEDSPYYPSELFLLGYFDDETSGNPFYAGMIGMAIIGAQSADIWGNPSPMGSAYIYNDWTTLDQTNFLNIGTFLVRESTGVSVPEPGSLALLAAGLAGLTLTRRRPG